MTSPIYKFKKPINKSKNIQALQQAMSTNGLG